MVPLKQSVEIRDIRLTGELHEHEALVHQLSMELFNGLIKAQGKTGTGSPAPPFSGTVTIEGIQLGPAMTAAGAEHLSTSGTAAGNIAIGGRGFTMPEFDESARGRWSYQRQGWKDRGHQPHAGSRCPIESGRHFS